MVPDMHHNQHMSIHLHGGKHINIKQLNYELETNNNFWRLHLLMTTLDIII